MPMPRPSNNYGEVPSVDEARAIYQKSGSRQDAERFARARLREVISDDFLNQ